MDKNNVIPNVVCGTRVGHTVALCGLKQSFCDLIWGKKENLIRGATLQEFQLQQHPPSETRVF